MPFLCVYSGDVENFEKIRAKLPSAEIKNDGQLDCIAVSDEDMGKYEQMIARINQIINQ
jgi:hypothetical protein